LDAACCWAESPTSMSGRPPVAQPSRSFYEGLRRPPLPVALPSQRLDQTTGLSAVRDEHRELSLEQLDLTVYGKGQIGR